MISSKLENFINIFKNKSSEISPKPNDLLFRKIHRDVARLLNYAVRQPNMTLRPDFLQKTIPLLSRDLNSFSDNDRIELWNAYNQLSTLLAPVTADSLGFEELYIDKQLGDRKQDFKDGLLRFKDFSTLVTSILILIITICLQYHSILLNNSYENLSALKADYEKVIDQETLSISAGGVKDNDALKMLVIEENKLLMQLKPATVKQEKLSNANSFITLVWANYDALFDSYAEKELEINGKAGFDKATHPTTSAQTHSIDSKSGNSDIQIISRPDKKQTANSELKTDKAASQPMLEQTNVVNLNNAPQSNSITISDNKTITSCIYQDLSKDKNELACFLSRVDAALRNGKSKEQCLNTILLPIFMGMIGALAYLFRNRLRHIENHSYIPAKDQSYPLRVIMGGLLGFMGPMIYTSGKVDDFGLGVSLFAFLLGYSFELAFGVLDKFINFLRDAIKPGEDKTKDEKVKQSPIADNPNEASQRDNEGKPNGLDDRQPSANDNKQPAVSDIDNLKTYQSHGRVLRELIALEPVLQASVQPEFYAEECAAKVQNAKDLLQQLENAYQTHGSDQVKFKERLDQISTAIASIDGSNNPLAIWLNLAKQSFSAATGGNEEQSKNLVITLFSASAAAFRSGSEAFVRWMAYAWAQPFTDKYFSGLAFGAQEADQCLKSSSMFSQAFENQPSIAKKLVDLAKESFTDQELAERIWQGLIPLEGVTSEFLTSTFGSSEVFAEGWKEFRHNLLRIALQNKDFPSGRFIADDLSLLSVSDILNAIDLLRQDAGAEKDLDVICYLAQELMKQAQTNASLDTIALIKRLLGGQS